MIKYKTVNQTSKNASSFHKKILELLNSEESPFKNFIIKQECRVSQINSSFRSGRERYDIVIFHPIKIVIEIHGQQHYSPSTFGGISKEEALFKFKKQKEIDEVKEMAAIKAGWSYLAIPYYDTKLSIQELTERIIQASS